MNDLPHVCCPREIVVARSHRNSYDHALRTAGARLVEVGLPDPSAGAGVRDVEPWEYAAAIGPATAAIFFTAMPGNCDLLALVSAVAHARDLPVIVDAAAELPPAANLRRFIANGADLVVFSGGKALGGPSASGMLAGRRDLIASAAIQCLDLDVTRAEFAPPPRFIDMSRYAGLPRHGVGRAAKLGKHEIAGLLAALRHFLSEDDAMRHGRWLATCRLLVDSLPLGRASLVHECDTGRVPLVALDFPSPSEAMATRLGLQGRQPPVYLATDARSPTVLHVNPVCLHDTDFRELVDALIAC